jgi:hypothetical protein
MRCFAPSLAFLLFVPAAALARPADKVVDLKPGEEKILRAGDVDARFVESDNPKAVAVETLPAGEVFLTAAKAGNALVQIELVDGGLVFWRVRVGAKAPAALGAKEKEKAKKACGELEEADEEGEKVLQAKVPDGGCVAALKELFATDGFPAAALRLTFTPEAFSAQVEAFKKRLAKEKVTTISVAGSGANVTLAGKASTKDVRKVRRILFDEAVGRLVLDDQVERPPGDPDAVPREVPLDGMPEKKGETP